jgi:hypothetical protein
VSIGKPFSPLLNFYGFSIGMTLSAAETAIDALGLIEEEGAATFRRFSGRTPEGFEISVGFGEELNWIALSQPNHKAIMERRTSFWTARAAKQQQRQERANAWKQIAGDDAMLADWAAHCRPWNDYSPSGFVAFADWLRTASSDERHMAAMVCNWDYGLAPLIWISRRPDCDLATAWLIFLGCEPSYYLEFEDDTEHPTKETSNDAYHLMIEVKARLESGFYSRRTISFDVSRDIEILAARRSAAARLAAILPRNVESRHDGRRITHLDFPEELQKLAVSIA